MAGRHRAPRPPLRRRLVGWFRPAERPAPDHDERVETAADLLERLETSA